MRSGKLLLGVLAGFAVGAALGVLFAPDKGWNTRKRISKKGEDLVDDLREKFDEFIDSIIVGADEVKEEAADFSNKAKSGSNKAKNKRKASTT
jgi:gas vesicle protein